MTSQPARISGFDLDAVAIGHVDGQMLAITGRADGTVRLWRASEQGLEPAGLTQAAHSSRRLGVPAVAIGHANGQMLAITGSRDGIVKLWSQSDSNLVCVLEDACSSGRPSSALLSFPGGRFSSGAAMVFWCSVFEQYAVMVHISDQRMAAAACPGRSRIA